MVTSSLCRRLLFKTEHFPKPAADPHQYVEAGGFEQRDLIGDGQGREAWELLGKLHGLNDALGGQFAELVPEAHIQSDTVLRAVALQDGIKEPLRKTSDL